MKRCPHCGNTTFKAVIKRAGLVQMEEDGTVTIIRELTDFKYEIAQCVKCKEKVINTELVEQVPCTKCKTMTEPNELVDGICTLCYAEEQMPDIANASREDLIRMIVRAKMHSTNTVADKIEKKIEAAVETVVKVADKEVKAEEEKVAPTPKKRAKRKTKAEKDAIAAAKLAANDTSEDEDEEEDDTSEEVDSAVGEPVVQDDDAIEKAIQDAMIPDEVAVAPVEEVVEAPVVVEEDINPAEMGGDIVPPELGEEDPF